MMAACATLTLIGAVVCLASLVTLHVLPTGLNPVRQPVSRYALGRFRAGYWVACWSAALAGAAAALLLPALSDRGSVATILLWAFAAARLLIVFVPMDDPDETPTGRGRAHTVLAIVAFACVTAAALLEAGPLHDGGQTELAIVATSCGLLMMLGTIGILASPYVAAGRFFGIAERLIYAGFLAWFILTGTAVLAG